MTRQPPKKRYPPEPLAPAEVRAVLAQCSRRAPTGVRNRALVMLLYRSGLRVSEALALKPSGVDLDAHTARVLHGKGDKATVRGFHPSAADALSHWLDARRALAKARGWKNGPLFCTLDGGPLSDRYVRDMLKRYAARAGVDKRVHPHGLRHTYADELRRAGADVVTISKLLGHSSIAVTARYLDHLTNAQAVEALAGLDLPDVGAEDEKPAPAAKDKKPQPPASDTTPPLPAPEDEKPAPKKPAPKKPAPPAPPEDDAEDDAEDEMVAPPWPEDEIVPYDADVPG